MLSRVYTTQPVIQLQPVERSCKRRVNGHWRSRKYTDQLKRRGRVGPAGLTASLQKVDMEGPPKARSSQHCYISTSPAVVLMDYDRTVCASWRVLYLCGDDFVRVPCWTHPRFRTKASRHETKPQPDVYCCAERLYYSTLTARCCDIVNGF